MKCDREDVHEVHRTEGTDDDDRLVFFTCKGVAGPGPGKANITVVSIPDGHLIVGHMSYLKLIDGDGETYWGLRSAGMNVMESIGCAVDMLEEGKSAVLRLPTDRGDDLP